MKILTLFVALICSLSIFAQNRQESWFRLGLNTWKNDIGFTLELQHRRQDNYWKEEDKNKIAHPLKTIIRPFVHKKFKNHWMLTFSPLAYIRTTDILNKQGNTRLINDFRTTFGVQKSIHIKRVQIRNRLWYELRLRNPNNTYEFSTRARLQTAITTPICKNVNYQIINELFVTNQFDQNRLYGGLQFKLNKQELNIGYQWSEHVTNDRCQLVININITN